MKNKDTSKFKETRPQKSLKSGLDGAVETANYLLHEIESPRPNTWVIKDRSGEKIATFRIHI